jgi:hypothetical protein
MIVTQSWQISYSQGFNGFEKGKTNLRVGKKMLRAIREESHQEILLVAEKKNGITIAR